jgi:hypothetical protein
MMKTLGFAAFGAALAGGATMALAQMSAPPIPSELPDVSAISAANAAGVLQYCVGKGLTSSVSGDMVLAGLLQRPEVAKSPDYSAGKAGTILPGKGKSYSVGAVNSYLQSQACDRVLQQAKQLK